MTTEPPAEAAQLIDIAGALNWEVVTSTSTRPDGTLLFTLYASNTTGESCTTGAWIAADWQTADGSWTIGARKPYLMIQGNGAVATLSQLADVIRHHPARH
ncbi:hypothetical protein ACFV1W_25200 [Kitasatospora sp. NPDC059648]|uniref:hypothetical protein n=1 Tax=Kitasatospora sp. NPDC059648 TaxID=3346894 RepID=UPI0036A602B4